MGDKQSVAMDVDMQRRCVTFRFDNGDVIEAGINCHYPAYVTITADDGIDVMPVANNMVRVGMRKR